MKRFIHKDQMNNSIFFVIVELVVLFMFRSSIHMSHVMINTFSVIVIMIFIIPVVLSYFSTDILRIFNYMIMPRFQSKKNYLISLLKESSWILLKWHVYY